MRSRRVALCLWALLSACSIDRDYSLHHPINISKQWSTQDKYTTKPVRDARHFAWWHQYHDPALNKLIALGLKCNNDIHVAMANIEASEGELKRVELNWLPTIAAGAGYSSYPYWGFPGVLATIAIPLYTVNIFNQIKSQQRAYYQVKVSKAMRDGVKLTVIADISAAYFSHIAQEERLHLLRDVEKDLAESLRIYRQTYQHGLSTQIEVESAQAKLKAIQAEETVVKKNLVLTQNALRYLINENPHPFIFKKKFKNVDSYHKIVNSLPLETLQHRPDMVAARQELRATRSGIGVALSRFMPDINLGIARGDIATIPNGSTLGTGIHFNQIIASQPLLTLSSLGELDAARGISKAAYYRYEDTLRKVLRDVDNDLAAHRYATERLDKIIEAHDAIGRAYRLQQDLYQQGLKSYLNLLREKVVWDEVKIVVNKQKIDQTLTIIHLYEDLAVGYDYQMNMKKSCTDAFRETVYDQVLPAVLCE